MRASAERSLTQRLRHRGEVRINGRPRRQFAGCARFLAFPCEHKDRLRSYRDRSLEVAQAVAHRRHALERGVEALGDGEEHPRARLAAGRLRLGRVGAVEHRLDAPARLVDGLVHLRVDRVERSHVEETAADSRLIRCYDDTPALLREARDRIEACRDGAPLVGVLDEVAAVEIDDAVAVEDDELHAASLEMSENRFIALRISVSSASRFSRSFLSSAITMTASKNESTGLFNDAKVFRYPEKSPESNSGFAERVAACKASKSAISAGSLSAETSASTNDSPLLSACRSMLAIRLFAAARLAASGSAANARTASSCLGMRVIAIGFRLRTASTSFVV